VYQKQFDRGRETPCEHSESDCEIRQSSERYANLLRDKDTLPTWTYRSSATQESPRPSFTKQAQ
jgi:hypothetical protein